MSASFPILERFTDHLGWMRRGLAVMLGGLVLSSLAHGARTERKERVGTRPKASASLKGECPGDTAVECWNGLAVRLAREGKLEDARQAIELAFQADPRLMALRGNLEKVYANLARQAYDSALGLSEAKPQVDLAALPRPAARGKADRLAQASPKPAKQPLPAKASSAVPDSHAEPSAAPSPPPVATPPTPAQAVAPAVPPVAVRKEVPAVPKPAPAEAKAVKAPLPPAPVAVPTPSIPKPAPLVAVRKDSASPVRPASSAEIPPRVLPRPRPVAVAVDTAKPAKPSSSRSRKDSVRSARAEVRKRPDPAADRQAVRKALDSWAAHWSSKDVEGYLSWYAPSFVPANGSDRAAWESQRRERLTAPASIEVKIESLHLESVDSGRVASQFLQSYRTEAVKLRSRKRLLWERVGAEWKIVSEGEAK